MINEEELEKQMIDDINNNCLDEIVIDTINELKKVQDTFNTDSIEVLNEDAQFENVCEVVSDENKNN